MSDQCLFWAILSVVEGILTNPAYYQNNSEQSNPLLREFWLILPTSEGILTNPTKRILHDPAYCPRISNQSHLLLKFWPIMQLTEILTNAAHYCWNFWPVLPASRSDFDRSCPILEEMVFFLLILPCYEEIFLNHWSEFLFCTHDFYYFFFTHTSKSFSLSQNW